MFGFDTIKPGSGAGAGRQAAGAAYRVLHLSRAACCGRSTPGFISPTKPANAADPILALVPEDRRGTLIAHKQAGGGQTLYRFDIRMQGENETVFFDI